MNVCPAGIRTSDKESLIRDTNYKNIWDTTDEEINLRVQDENEIYNQIPNVIVATKEITELKLGVHKAAFLSTLTHRSEYFTLKTTIKADCKTVK